ncbi:hypothetical protein [Mycobacterium sp. 1274756.6]|uniref:hypothetical protein n=1 Tax=Mycobacterium sp. 1274756.6 TaxID=1834076 RepID=UPI0012E8C508|nr:hypothetical protein [Mycobacterium sp. 1274756.6]
MAAVEAIYLVAAVLWILVVSAAVIVGCRVALTVRRKRRRVQRWADAVRAPLAVGAGVLVSLRGGRRPAPARIPAGVVLQLQRLARQRPPARWAALPAGAKRR